MNKIFLILLTFLGSLSVMASPIAKQGPITIKWVLAHEPIDLFKEAAEMFAKEVDTKTKGAIKVEVLTLNEYEKKFNKGQRIRYGQFVKMLQEGTIPMSQTYTTDLGKYNKEMYALDLPFLFRDHTHAKKVLEGDIGNKLLAGLSSSNIKGLAFTYSGGYRILPGTKKIEKIEDFKGMSIRTSLSPVAQETFNILGAKSIPMTLGEIEEGIKTGKIDEAESTYARYFTLGQNEVAKIVNETNHSLFLTSIIINETFWKTLPPEYQNIMKDAAINAARVEREHSITRSEETKKRIVQNGIKIYSLSPAEENRFKIAMEPVYKKFSPMIGEELISEIKAQ